VKKFCFDLMLTVLLLSKLPITWPRIQCLGYLMGKPVKPEGSPLIFPLVFLILLTVLQFVHQWVWGARGDHIYPVVSTAVQILVLLWAHSLLAVEERNICWLKQWITGPTMAYTSTFFYIFADIAE
jgi:hypothetical protein